MFRPSPSDPAVELKRRLATIQAEGRTHIDPAASPYAMPNSHLENMRLNLQHYILQKILHGNYVAPLGGAQTKPEQGIQTGNWTSMVLGQFLDHQQVIAASAPRRILDVGCGTGRWAFEMARQFPQAEIIGLDIVEPDTPYTDHHPRPANYRFQLGNMMEIFPFSDKTFDVVHLRCLGTGIPAPRWKDLVQEVARLTAPGGWVESVEFGMPTNGGPAFTHLQQALAQLSGARGIDFACLRIIDSYMRQSSFPLDHIQSRVLDIPIGAHGKGIGLHMAWNVMLSMNALTDYVHQLGLFGQDAWKDLKAAVEAELYAGESQPTAPLYIAIGRRKDH